MATDSEILSQWWALPLVSLLVGICIGLWLGGRK